MEAVGFTVNAAFVNDKMAVSQLRLLKIKNEFEGAP